MTFTAEQAYNFGMLNYVVPDDKLAEKTLELACKIASLSCNQALDAQGFWTAQQAPQGEQIKETKA